MWPAPRRLAYLLGAPIIPAGFARVRAHEATVELLADEIIRPSGTGDREADVRALTAAMMAAHERIIRRYPEQWYMFRQMWQVGEHE